MSVLGKKTQITSVSSPPTRRLVRKTLSSSLVIVVETAKIGEIQ